MPITGSTLRGSRRWLATFWADGRLRPVSKSFSCVVNVMEYISSKVAGGRPATGREDGMANKLGCHSLMFGESWDEAAARRTIDTVARLGFDVVETLMFDVDAVDGRMTRRLAADAGIEVALGMALGPDAD